jgi:phosphoribosyl-dephospho-CoA transferase
MLRHDLAWLAPGAAAVARFTGSSTTPEHTARALLDDWIGRGHPLIITRQPPDAEAVALGLALPRSRGKARLAVLVPWCCVREARRPPELAAARERLPAAWQPKLRALLASREVVATAPRLYGSAAMEVVTGEPCLGPTSDLDLLLAPPTWAAALTVATTMATIDQSVAGPRLDGEIRNRDGVAIAWRELASRPLRVLTKSRTHVELVSTARFAAGFAAFEAVAC